MVIRTDRSLWLVDPTKLAPPTRIRRKIGKHPLFDLAALKAMIATDELNEDDVRLVTRSADRDLQNLGWHVPLLLTCIGCLEHEDHVGAEWCEDSHGGCFACDAYRVTFDEQRQRRDPRALSFYLKFSIDETHGTILLMVRIHL